MDQVLQNTLDENISVSKYLTFQEHCEELGKTKGTSLVIKGEEVDFEQKLNGLITECTFTTLLFATNRALSFDLLKAVKSRKTVSEVIEGLKASFTGQPSYIVFKQSLTGNEKWQVCH